MKENINDNSFVKMVLLVKGKESCETRFPLLYSIYCNCFNYFII